MKIFRVSWEILIKAVDFTSFSFIFVRFKLQFASCQESCSSSTNVLHYWTTGKINNNDNDEIDDKIKGMGFGGRGYQK